MAKIYLYCISISRCIHRFVLKLLRALGHVRGYASTVKWYVNKRKQTIDPRSYLDPIRPSPRSHLRTTTDVEPVTLQR